MTKNFMKSALLWEERKLGCEEQYVSVASKEDMESVNKILGITRINLNIKTDLYEKLKNEAKLKGINESAYIREIVESYMK